MSDCSNCPMVAPAGDPDREHERWFTAETRCCTYHPKLPNFLVGKALLDGGVSRERIIKRIELQKAVAPLGISAPAEWKADYKARPGAFGHDIDLRCPYWVGGELSCGIWKSRNFVCRTWHCKHKDGAAGFNQWFKLKLLMGEIEHRLALHCCKTGKVPKGSVQIGTWVSWFEWCARKVATMSTTEIENERGDKTDDMRAAWREAHAGMEREMPDVLGVTVNFFERLESGRTRLIGYSVRDDLIGGPKEFTLLSKIDGIRPWREALTLAEAELGEPIGEEAVRNLWRMGMLREHDQTEQWRPSEPVTGVPEVE